MSDTRSDLRALAGLGPEPGPRRRSDDALGRATDRIEHEAIAITFDLESDHSEREHLQRIPFDTVQRICRTFAVNVRARGGRL
jgi:hypothetical protein